MKFSKQFTILFVILMIIPMIFIGLQNGNTYLKKEKIESGEIVVTEEKITTSDIIQAYITYAIAIFSIYFFVSISEKADKKKR